MNQNETWIETIAQSGQIMMYSTVDHRSPLDHLGLADRADTWQTGQIHSYLTSSAVDHIGGREPYDIICKVLRHVSYVGSVPYR